MYLWKYFIKIFDYLDSELQKEPENEKTEEDKNESEDEKTEENKNEFENILKEINKISDSNSKKRKEIKSILELIKKAIDNYDNIEDKQYYLKSLIIVFRDDLYQKIKKPKNPKPSDDQKENKKIDGGEYNSNKYNKLLKKHIKGGIIDLKAAAMSGLKNVAMSGLKNASIPGLKNMTSALNKIGDVPGMNLVSNAFGDLNPFGKGGDSKYSALKDYIVDKPEIFVAGLFISLFQDVFIGNFNIVNYLETIKEQVEKDTGYNYSLNDLRYILDKYKMKYLSLIEGKDFYKILDDRIAELNIKEREEKQYNYSSDNNSDLYKIDTIIVSMSTILSEEYDKIKNKRDEVVEENKEIGSSKEEILEELSELENVEFLVNFRDDSGKNKTPL